MDPFEEFEFKPLTDGLGFHSKKKNEENFLSRSSSVVSKEESNLEKNTPLKTMLSASGDLVSPLPKKTPVKEQPINQLFIEDEKVEKDRFNKSSKKNLDLKTKNSPALPGQKADIIDELVRNFRNPKGQFEENANLVNSKNKNLKIQQQIDSRNQKINLTSRAQLPWSFMPFVVDAMMTLALSLISLIIALLYTDADLIGQLTRPNPDIYFLAAVALVFIGSMFSYTVGMRTFFGATLGEIVFDMQTGDFSQEEFYSVKVFARSFLVIATGIVVLPILSLLLQRDLAGEWTKTELSSSFS